MIKWILCIVFMSVNAQAAVEKWGINPQTVELKKVAERAQEGFFSVTVRGFELSRKVGEPELPVKSVLLIGQPQDLKVKVDVVSSFSHQNIIPMPVQRQLCRCANDQTRGFEYNEASYRDSTNVKMEFLGWFRGQPITRVDVAMAQYNAQTRSITFYSDVNISYNSSVFSMQRGIYSDYLIVVPAALQDGITDFVAWKKSQGFNIMVEVLQTPQITLQGIATLIKDHYTNDGVDFVLMIGDETVLPMHIVPTSNGNATSDIKYFTLDGSGDSVPDLFYGRIPATSVTEVRANLEKSISFDKTGTKDAKGVQHVIGIASNEGSSPSDDEYVTSIEEKLVEVYGYKTTHFQQDDKNSNPTELNASIDQGAAWLFYMGHGSGSSWPSMNKTYSTSHIANLKNVQQIKPIIIDVACQNGRLLPGYLGTSFTDTLSANAHGAAAYYGGTVNISWHPPAIMARGIAFEHATKNFTHLGEAILAGQLYLAANWNSKNDVIDNFEWYQLQGDPSMLIQQ